MMYGRRRRYNARTLKKSEVQTGCKEKSFQYEDSQQYNTLPRQVVQLPFLGVFKTQLDKDLSNWSDLIADLALSRRLVHPTLLVTGLSFELSCPQCSL